MSSENQRADAPKPDARPRSESEHWAPWEKESIAHFIRAMSRERDAMNSYASLIRQGDCTAAIVEIAVGVPMAEARDAAGLVRHEVLAKLHPELPQVWRQTFMQVVGMNSIWTMAGQPPFFDETLRQQLVDLDRTWDQWWASHRRDLDIPDDMPLWDAEKKDFVMTASAQWPM
jgi:hypothetical protein